MNTIKQVLGRLQRPALRRWVATLGVAAITATTLLSPQSAAAATSYTVYVRFNSVSFRNVDDGSIYTGWFNYKTDTDMEVYGHLYAYTPAGAASAGYFPFRNFGTWGSNPSGCPASGVWWESDSGATCVKEVSWDDVHYWNATTKNLGNTLLCSSVNWTSCGTAYSKWNNAIKLTVHPGETIHVGVHMKDRDWGSSDDEVCTDSVDLGPFTEAQLKYINEPHSLGMSDNGNASCTVSYSLSSY